VKHSLSFWSKVLLPLAAAAAAGIAVPAAAARAGSAPASTASTQSTCSLNLSPPPGFREQKVQVNGIGINYVRGGQGPTLLPLHGYPATWTEWDDILPALARHYTVVAPDLPGAGGSDAPAPAANYTKKAIAADIYGLMVKLGLSHNISIVGHDTGTMVAYSYAAAHPGDVVKLALSEAPIPDSSIYTLPAPTPEHQGRGLAASIVGSLVNDIRAGGRRPFLNVTVENVRARRLYEKLGFKDRMQMTVRVLQPCGAATSR
jgi:pimeloyl-ACP methyl ester carboxylesterase